MQYKLTPIDLRDAVWLAVAFALSGFSSGVFAATVLAPSRTLLDFDWVLILCSVGLGMFGGLAATVAEMRRAAIEKTPIDIPLQIASDLCIAAILSTAAFAFVSLAELPHEYLLGLLPLLGVAGQKVLGPAVQGLVAVVTGLFKRLIGKAEP